MNIPPHWLRWKKRLDTAFAWFLAIYVIGTGVFVAVVGFVALLHAAVRLPSPWWFLAALVLVAPSWFLGQGVVRLVGETQRLQGWIRRRL